MDETLNQDIAFKALQKFMQEKPFILFGSGTSCAVDLNYGMNALRDHLINIIPGKIRNQTGLSQWQDVKHALDNGSDLESAMNAVQNDELTQIIIDTTAQYFCALDEKYCTKIMLGEINWPTVQLIKVIVDNLPMNDRVLHVATTNYDLLFEYSLEMAKIKYITGFYGGINRSLDWKRAVNMFLYFEESSRRGKIRKTPKCYKHVRLYKVHGSLNTFRINNEIIENNTWLYNKPDTIERMMITPGTNKHERLQQNRQELLGEYDRAVAGHSAFLFIGFGFNDSQLSNDAIKRKLKEQECPGLILTRDSNPRIEEIIKECKNVWLVCKPENQPGTRISNYCFENPLLIDTDELWNPYVFVEKILGG